VLVGNGAEPHRHPRRWSARSLSGINADAAGSRVAAFPFPIEESMKYRHRASLGPLGSGIRNALVRVEPLASRPPPAEVQSTAPVADHAPIGAEGPREFHRRMAAIIDAAQAAIWARGTHELLGYATDYALGQERGVQTLVLKTRRRSAYVRVHWNTVMGDSAEDRRLMSEIVDSAIQQLA
jgi:hypothetical protein